MSPVASQTLCDRVELAVRNGASTLDEVVARTFRGRGACAEALRLLVELGELATAGWGRSRVYAVRQADADRLLAQRMPLPLERDTVAGEFIATRRARWARQLQAEGLRSDLARERVAGIVDSAGWRALRCARAELERREAA